MKRKIMIGCIALVGLALAIALYNMIEFPLSKQKVEENMKAQNVCAVGEEQGAWAFVVKESNGYCCYVFKESVFFERYKLDMQLTYADTYTTVAYGKNNAYVLELNEQEIQLIFTDTPRVPVKRMLSLAIFFCLVVAALIKADDYFTATRRKKSEGDTDIIRAGREDEGE